MSGWKVVRRALLSVTDKAGVVGLGRGLAGLGVELVSTGGTARVLREAGLAVREVEELTGWPEMLDGRVKTLHPRVHGGILYRRGLAGHEAAVAEHGVSPIDMVVVNLYAFEKAAGRAGARFGELIESIDIGGPSMLRSAAKNFEDVAVVSGVGEYEAVLGEMAAHGGALSRATRWRLAKGAFGLTAAYDVAIANALERVGGRVAEAGAGGASAGAGGVNTAAGVGGIQGSGASLAAGVGGADEGSGGIASGGVGSLTGKVAGAEAASLGAAGAAGAGELAGGAGVPAGVAGVGSGLERLGGLDAGVEPPAEEELAMGDGSGDGAGGQVAAGLPETLRLVLPRRAVLRYGENPHQGAALYTDGSKRGIAGALQLQGKELSYNNLVDLDACWELTREFEPGGGELAGDFMVAIVKHTNPCGAATGGSVTEAYGKALAADPVSAFGGVIGVNGVVDEEAAAEMVKLFVEAVVAPGFTPGARERFRAKKNVRLLEMEHAGGGYVVKHVSGGLLVQEADHRRVSAEEMRVVTRRAPSEEEWRALLFAWRVCKHVKSNAVVYARDGQTVGVGAGQMSRVDAARFGAQKAVLPLAGTVAASDAFFPFADGLEAVVEAGATAVVQPGGSVRDAEVVAAADRLGVAMVLTGVRHFKH